MSNNGLEALAALASAAPSSGDAGDASHQNDSERQQSEVAPPASPSSASTSNPNVAMTSLPNAGNTQQLAQALQNLQSAGLNQAALNPTNLALLARLQQQQQQQADNAQNMAAAQQMAAIQQLNFLLQQQPQAQHPQQASIGGISPFQLALGGNAASLFPQQADDRQKVLPSVASATPSSTMPPPTRPDEGAPRDKRQQKRAANRRSAQLSRKRKKQFIEELKDENDDLRRKEQILRSIPDLVVVFDSSGRLWFVSESVGRLLQYTASELEGTSFWDRLCVDSVRLLKAAFMDSLAARQADSDTAPLGSGVWELRLVDKDESQKIVTLNGVVHFAGERPECVCSIRPLRTESSSSSSSDEEAGGIKESDTSSSESMRIKPHQSVVHKSVRVSGKKNPTRISDSNSGNSSSMESESGSSDELNVRESSNPVATEGAAAS